VSTRVCVCVQHGGASRDGSLPALGLDHERHSVASWAVEAAGGGGSLGGGGGGGGGGHHTRSSSVSSSFLAGMVRAWA
jgi:hypothetical protein